MLVKVTVSLSSSSSLLLLLLQGLAPHQPVFSPFPSFQTPRPIALKKDSIQTRNRKMNKNKGGSPPVAAARPLAKAVAPSAMELEQLQQLAERLQHLPPPPPLQEHIRH